CAMMLKNEHGKPRKKTVLQKMLDGFNNWFTNLTGSYQGILGKIVNKRVITFLMLIAFCIGIWLVNNNLPSGFIPNEDQGMFYAVIQTPPGSSLERTNEIAERIQKMAETIDGVQSVSSLAGYEILTEGTGSNSGTCLVNLKSWEDRKHSVQEIITEMEE